MEFHKIENKVFYLEVKNAPKLENEAIKYIHKYGGIVSNFLDAKVHYILHNNPVQQLKSQEKIVPIPQTNTTIVTPKKPLFGLSRSQRLLAASVKTAPPVPSLQEVNHKALQCKSLAIKEFLQFFTKVAEEEARIAREIARATDPNKRSLKKFKGRYIKICFNPSRYRSMFKEFVSWPELDMEFERGEFCPFASTQNMNGVLNPGVVQEALQDLQLQQQQAQQQCTGSPSAMASNAGPATPNNTNSTFSTTLPSKMTTPFASHSIKTLSRSRRSLNTQKKPGIYCEICSVDFDDYEEHMNDEKHIQYLKNSENYQELVSLVQTLPNHYQKSLPLPPPIPTDSPLNPSFELNSDLMI